MIIPAAVAAPFAAVVGVIFGSFATVMAYRVPRRESPISGRSKCPACDHTITASENIPVVSWLLQRGRCRHCGEGISVRYPVTELATAALFAASVLRFGPSLEAAVYAAFFWILVVLSSIDLEYKLLPNRVVYPAFIAGWVGLAAVALLDGAPERLVDAARGAAVFGGLLFVIAFVYPPGMGGGDVKLAFVLGTFLGYVGGVGVTLVGMFLSFLLGGVIGMILMVAAGGSRKSQLPFGPFLATGSVIGILAGVPLLSAYLGSF